MLDLIQGFLFLRTSLSPIPCTGCPFGLEHIFPLSFIDNELSPSAPRQLLSVNQTTVSEDSWEIHSQSTLLIQLNPT